ncbi:MAG: hypothetical protein V4623_04010 [Pseudomonadota bacterium]
MNKTLLSLTLSAVLTLASVSAQANPTLEKNGVMTNKDGRSLYTFDKDTPGASNCNGPCTKAWAPFAVANPAAADANFTAIKREDGSQQWAYKGMPLYLYAGDLKPGDVNGDMQGKVWHALRSGAKAAAPAATNNQGSAY